MTTTLIIGLLIPLLGTMLGSAFVFFMKDEMSARLQKSLLGFASGVMVAASVWSLLIPSMEMMEQRDKLVWSMPSRDRVRPKVKWRPIAAHGQYFLPQ